jgi:hypothetical protein
MEGVGGATERGSGGDDIVDDDDTQPGHIGADPEPGATKPIGSTQPGLGGIIAVAFEQAATRNTELGSRPPCDEFGLVEPALAATAAAGWRPGHCVDPDFGTHPRSNEPIDQETGQMAGELPAIAIFEAEQHIAGATAERHRRDHLGTVTPSGGGGTRRGNEGEPAGATQHLARPVASGTT